MTLIKYPKFAQTGQANISVAGTSTAIAFAQNFDLPPVVVASPSTLTDLMITGGTTAGFNIMTAAACTIQWIAIYQSI